MSTRYNDGSHYENHPTAAELNKLPEHTHQVGELHGKQDHLTAHELSKHERDEHERAHVSNHGHGIATFGHREITALAHELWLERGSPDGSPEEDWFRAAEQLRARAHTPA
jgi:hypothetical protein